MVRLNGYPPEIQTFLHELPQLTAQKYIANGIPCNMLHTIYNEVCADLDRELDSGGGRKAKYCPPIFEPAVYNLSTKSKSQMIDEFIMAKQVSRCRCPSQKVSSHH
mmetsp:Transcript_9124/g.27328  ORF Transcript_9124/g.27328 Transcript_9124/m.27328 type:complete len:106 (-) Transcript_9124:400-717(-)